MHWGPLQATQTPWQFSLLLQPLGSRLEQLPVAAYPSHSQSRDALPPLPFIFYRRRLTSMLGMHLSCA
jgi:hypothetical protein